MTPSEFESIFNNSPRCAEAAAEAVAAGADWLEIKGRLDSLLATILPHLDAADDLDHFWIRVYASYLVRALAVWNSNVPPLQPDEYLLQVYDSVIFKKMQRGYSQQADFKDLQLLVRTAVLQFFPESVKAGQIMAAAGCSTESFNFLLYIVNAKKEAIRAIY